MAATLISTPSATLNQGESSIILTSGSTARINAPAAKVFDTILDTANYDKWSSWTPGLLFPADQSIRQPGSVGKLQTKMPNSGSMEIPVKILEVSFSPERHLLAWTGQFLPRWFAVAERMQAVTPISETECELRQWESMSGWGTYLLKWFMGVQKQLDDSNMAYATELKAYCESKFESR